MTRNVPQIRPQVMIDPILHATDDVALKYVERGIKTIPRNSSDWFNGSK